MKLTAIILAVIGLLLSAYGWWGMFTKAGQKRYDEMDGFYPFFIVLAGAGAIVIAIVLFIIAAWGGWRSK